MGNKVRKLFSLSRFWRKSVHAGITVPLLWLSPTYIHLYTCSDGNFVHATPFFESPDCISMCALSRRCAAWFARRCLSCSRNPSIHIALSHIKTLLQHIYPDRLTCTLRNSSKSKSALLIPCSISVQSGAYFTDYHSSPLAAQPHVFVTK